MDWISALLIALLAATLLAYFYGIFHYPYGVLILLAMLVSRILLLQNKKRR
mgnify:FL=1|tara:strand:- start:1230 stop:1382 length:153 start_codon:yes stop_codon:yes gene_type:complete